MAGVGFHKFGRVLSDQSDVFKYRFILMRWFLVAGRGWQRASGCVGEVGCVYVQPISSAMGALFFRFPQDEELPVLQRLFQAS